MPFALVRSADDEPGKFAGVNIAFAGSFVSTPKLMVGTRVCAWYVSVNQSNLAPKLNVCVPCVQFNVSLMSRIRGLRRLGALVAVALLMLSAAEIVRLNPA